ncbi:hypothetical protein [Sorangium atrum]|uniref:DUF4351 domain-containing protein n=1 Tax=Sorangium atrum TaxID=2995308 RepID=A0ABT5CG91_9BACT|nr:hypothetical protein [Sorangium aterium]MDC0685453.1 hypothetical protein [Sorangium aterium]
MSGRALRQAIDDPRRPLHAASGRDIAFGPLLRSRAEVAERGPATREEGESVMARKELVGQFIEQGRAEGMAQAMAQATIELYEERFGLMPPALRSAVEATHDLKMLQTWLLVAGAGTREVLHDSVSASSSGRSS